MARFGSWDRPVRNAVVLLGLVSLLVSAGCTSSSRKSLSSFMPPLGKRDSKVAAAKPERTTKQPSVKANVAAQKPDDEPEPPKSSRSQPKVAEKSVQPRSSNDLDDSPQRDPDWAKTASAESTPEKTEKEDSLWTRWRGPQRGMVVDPFLATASDETESETESDNPFEDDSANQSGMEAELSAPTWDEATDSSPRDRLKQAIVGDQTESDPAFDAATSARRDSQALRVESLLAKAKLAEQNGRTGEARRLARLAVDLSKETQLEFGPDDERPVDVLARLELTSGETTPTDAADTPGESGRDAEWAPSLGSGDRIISNKAVVAPQRAEGAAADAARPGPRVLANRNEPRVAESTGVRITPGMPDPASRANGTQESPAASGAGADEVAPTDSNTESTSIAPSPWPKSAENPPERLQIDLSFDAADPESLESRMAADVLASPRDGRAAEAPPLPEAPLPPLDDLSLSFPTQFSDSKAGFSIDDDLELLPAEEPEAAGPALMNRPELWIGLLIGVGAMGLLGGLFRRRRVEPATTVAAATPSPAGESRPSASTADASQPIRRAA